MESARKNFYFIALNAETLFARRLKFVTLINCEFCWKFCLQLCSGMLQMSTLRRWHIFQDKVEPASRLLLQTTAVS